MPVWKGGNMKDVELRIAIIEEAVQRGRTGEAFCLAKVCIKHEISTATLSRWMAKVKNLPRSEWRAALQGRHNGGRKPMAIAPEVWGYFVDQYRLGAPCLAAHRMCVDRAQREGWTVPSLKTFQRRLARENLLVPNRRRNLAVFDV